MNPAIPDEREVKNFESSPAPVKACGCGIPERVQYPLIKEYGLNYIGLHSRI